MTNQARNPNDETVRRAAGGSSFFRRHRGSLIGWALVVALVVLQWPMFKGLIYRAFGSAVADTIPWRKDYASALKEAKELGRPVLIDFYASWCPPCQVMKHDVWPDAEVGKLASESYVPLLIDVDDPATRDVSQRYGVSSIPTVIIVDAEGNVLKRSGFMSRDATMEFLKRGL